MFTFAGIRNWAECQSLFEEIEQDVAKKKIKKKSDTLQLGYATGADIFGHSHEFEFGGASGNLEAAKLERDALADARREALDTFERIKHDPELLNAVMSSGSFATKQSTKGPCVSEVLESFLADRTKGRGLSENTADGYRKFIQTYIAVMGDMRVAEVSYDDATDFRDRLFSYPKNRNKSKAYRNKTEAELSAMEISKDDCLHGHTINNHIGHLKVLFDWLENRQVIERNPFKGVTVAYTAESYTEYSPEDLERIFNGPLWQPASKYARLATTTAAHWWAPLIALYSGARPTEIVQMRLDDISTVDGVLMASVVDDEEKGQQVKSEAGIRSFPVHPRLLELGFAEYMHELRNAGADRLLQGIPLAARKPGANLGKWWNERYRKINLPEFKEQRKVFYSFRHSYFTQALHEADIKLEYVQQMCGHESSHMGATAHYDKGAGAKRLFAEVSKLDLQCDSLKTLADDWKRLPRGYKLFCVNGRFMSDRYPVTKKNNELVQCRFPVPDGHRPFLRNIA